MHGGKLNVVDYNACFRHLHKICFSVSILSRAISHPQSRRVSYSLAVVLISFLWATELVRGYIIESVMQGWCDARPTVTFRAAEHYRCFLAGTFR